MTIIGVACVKNEEDIIEAFVRHNLFYLQKLIVLNHGSTDNTSAILSRLVAEGLALVVEDDPSLGKFQGEKMTRLMQRAVNEHGADWVLLLDADELIRCREERLPLPEPGNVTGFLKVVFRTYQVSQADDQSVLNPAERIRHRFEEEPREQGTLEERRYTFKAVVPRALAGMPGTCVVQGNHFILTANSEPPYELWPGFDYAHFSLRAVGQYTSKIAIGTLQQTYRSSPRGNMDSFYLTHLEELRTDFEGFSRRFHERFPSYLELTPSFTPVIIPDPLIYRGGPLRYTSSASDYTRLVSNLIGYAEVLAGALAKHAASTQVEANQIEEVAQLEFHGPESPGLVTHTISASSNRAQTVHFPLGAPPAPSVLNLRVKSMAAVVELVKVRWICEDFRKGIELSGHRLNAKTFLIRGALPLQHDQYFAFIKGGENAVIGLEAPSHSFRHPFNAVEIQIRMETDAARIGARLLHHDNISHVLSSSERLCAFERQLAERSSLRGARNFQIKKLWRAVSRPFKRWME
ncbi:MAG TPA: glycosyltransferase family 2 protein [Roseimicrobium sp.]|nr:glycosyltransferase family 2 protein [Roseimicrobium sp.]